MWTFTVIVHDLDGDENMNDRIRNVLEEDQRARVLVLNEESYAVVKESEQYLLDQLVTYFAVTGALFDSPQMTLRVYGDRLNKMLALESVELWLNDTSSTPWADPEVMRAISTKFSNGLFEQLRATRFMLPAVEEPEPIVQERLSSHKELPDDVKAQIEAGSLARVTCYPMGSPHEFGLLVKGEQVAVDLAKNMLLHWQRAGPEGVRYRPCACRTKPSGPPPQASRSPPPRVETPAVPTEPPSSPPMNGHSTPPATEQEDEFRDAERPARPVSPIIEPEPEVEVPTSPMLMPPPAKVTPRKRKLKEGGGGDEDGGSVEPRPKRSKTKKQQTSSSHSSSSSSSKPEDTSRRPTSEEADERGRRGSTPAPSPKKPAAKPSRVVALRAAARKIESSSEEEEADLSGVRMWTTTARISSRSSSEASTTNDSTSTVSGESSSDSDAGGLRRSQRKKRCRAQREEEEEQKRKGQVQLLKKLPPTPTTTAAAATTNGKAKRAKTPEGQKQGADDARAAAREKRRRMERAARFNMEELKQKVKQLFVRRFTHLTEDDVQVVEEEDGLPNAWYDELADTLVDAPETVALHGTRADYASGILKNNFDLEKISGGGDEGGYERVFYFATDPGVADRWRKGDDIVGGEAWGHCVVSSLLWIRGSTTKLSGCTGGTIKVQSSNAKLIQPLFRIKYRVPERPIQTFLDEVASSKCKLEQEACLLEAHILEHVINIRGELTMDLLQNYFR